MTLWGALWGAPYFYLAAVVVAAATAVASAYQAVVAAATEQDEQDDDPPAAVAAPGIVIAHNRTSKKIFEWLCCRSFHGMTGGKKCAEVKQKLGRRTPRNGKPGDHYNLKFGVRTGVL